jgi:hypothetical protein
LILAGGLAGFERTISTLTKVNLVRLSDSLRRYFRQKYTPQDANVKLVNREGGNSGMDKEPDEVLVDISVGADVAILKMGDGLDKEVKGASVTQKKRSKKGKGSRGERLDPAVAAIMEHTPKFEKMIYAKPVDEEEDPSAPLRAAEAWWVHQVLEKKLGVEAGIGLVFEAVISPGLASIKSGLATELDIMEDATPLLARLCGSTEGQLELLRRLGARAEQAEGGDIERFPYVLKASYDADVVDEDVLEMWQAGLAPEDVVRAICCVAVHPLPPQPCGA